MSGKSEFKGTLPVTPPPHHVLKIETTSITKNQDPNKHPLNSKVTTLNIVSKELLKDAKATLNTSYYVAVDTKREERGSILHLESRYEDLGTEYKTLYTAYEDVFEKYSKLYDLVKVIQPLLEQDYELNASKMQAILRVVAAESLDELPVFMKEDPVMKALDEKFAGTTV